MASTALTDIHPDIIKSHILPRLDGPSLSAAATASSYLQSLSADQNLWYDICNSTWPSITHPRLQHIISTFPDTHRSFFHDSFPVLATSHRRQTSEHRQTIHHHQPLPSELISAIDIRYQNNIVYSRLIFTDTTDEFLSSKLWIEVNKRNRCGSQHVGHGISQSIDLKVDENAGADDATVSHLKESLTLSWIVIDPMQKRAANLSSMRPVLARNDWDSNETIVRFDNILPGSGCDPNEMIQLRIEVKLGVEKGGVGLYVREVILHGQDLVGGSVSGKEFLDVIESAISEEKKVRRKVIGDDICMQTRYEEFKMARRQKLEWLQKQQKKRDVVRKVNDIIMLLYFLITCILCIKIFIN